MGEHRVDYRKLHSAPYLSKEQVLAKVSVTGGEFVNLHSEEEFFDYFFHLKKAGFDAHLIKDETQEELKGRYVLDVRGSFLDEEKSFMDGPTYAERMLDLAGDIGEELERILNSWVEKGEVDKQVLEFHLSGLKYHKIPPEVRDHYNDIYESFIEMEDRGLLRPTPKKS